ncbi:MAG: lipocalin-like domain-containing protein [Chloroflexota bacterium]
MPILGTWKLVSMETRSVTGSVTPGLYDDGYLLYTDDGYMSAVLTKGRRPRFATDNLTGGSAEEKARAVDTYLSYGGRYSVEGELVTHHVLFSLWPNWVGSDQVRRFALNPEGNTLTISTVNPVVTQGEESYSNLTWRRA